MKSAYIQLISGLLAQPPARIRTNIHPTQFIAEESQIALALVHPVL